MVIQYPSECGCSSIAMLFKLDGEANDSHFRTGIVELGIDDRKVANESITSAKVGCHLNSGMAGLRERFALCVVIESGNKILARKIS